VGGFPLGRTVITHTANAGALSLAPAGGDGPIGDEGIAGSALPPHSAQFPLRIPGGSLLPRLHTNAPTHDCAFECSPEMHMICSDPSSLSLRCDRPGSIRRARTSSAMSPGQQLHLPARTVDSHRRPHGMFPRRRQDGPRGRSPAAIARWPHEQSARTRREEEPGTEPG
jgi:hypothetical protein